MTDAAARVVGRLQAEGRALKKVSYLSREDALGEFRNWSGFWRRWTCWKKNAAGGSGGDHKLDTGSTASLNTLRDGISQINGIDESRMDDSWFARTAALTGLVGRVSAIDPAC